MITYTDDEKSEIRDKMQELQSHSSFPDSAKKYARTIGVTNIDLSNLYNGKWDRIGWSKWVQLSRIVGFSRTGHTLWNTAETFVYKYVTNQLQACQRESMTAMLVDDAGIGKTHAAREYSTLNKNAFYVDCSVVPRKISFVRKLASVVGLDSNGKIDDLISDTIYVFQNMDHPLLILDEAGDLDHATILVLKRIYNALEGLCGIYLIGADGLQSKIERGVKWKKLGYVEFFSRFGRCFRHALPRLADDKLEVFEAMASDISRANGITDSKVIEKLCTALWDGKTLNDMRRVKQLIQKQKRYELSTQ